MYDKGKRFSGILGKCVADLVNNGFFKRNTDVLSWAPVVGYIYSKENNRELLNYCSETNAEEIEKDVSGEQVEQGVLDFLLRLFVIRGHASDVNGDELEKLKKQLFGGQNFSYELLRDFEQYIDLGIKIMHKKLCTDFEVINDSKLNATNCSFNRFSRFSDFFIELAKRGQEIK